MNISSRKHNDKVIKTMIKVGFENKILVDHLLPKGQDYRGVITVKFSIK